jgi:hypothetical protein
MFPATRRVNASLSGYGEGRFGTFSHWRFVLTFRLGELNN